MKKEKIWITVKTYPVFSKKYFELVCTAGINERGEWRRLYPIPFRRMNEIEKYKKYQWIEAAIEKDTSDHRPESYKIKGEITIISSIDTKNCWEKRRHILKNTPTFDNKQEIIKKAHTNQLSLTIFRPKKIIGFEYEKTEREWSQETIRQLEAENKQLNLNLFEDFKKEIKLVKKVPYKFFYKFLDAANEESRLMIEDWEIGALYWNCLRKHGNEQKALIDVQNKYEGFISKNEVLLFLGTTKEFHIRKARNPYVIIGVFYPPKTKQRSVAADLS